MVMQRGMILRSPDLLDSLMRDRHSNRSLAREVGCHHSMIGHLRTGIKTSCGPELAYRITRALGVSPEALFDCDCDLAVGCTCPAEYEVLA